MSRILERRVKTLEDLFGVSANGTSTLLATVAEINRVADVSTRLVSLTAASVPITVADHEGKTLVLNRAAGIAATLPVATGSGARYRFVVGTTASGGSYVIRGGASDVLRGLAIQAADGGNT